jgi:acetyl esterase/lipase
MNIAYILSFISWSLTEFIHGPAWVQQVSFSVFKDEIYTTREATLRADVYVPNEEGDFPAVLLVHGGGWSSRSRDDMRFYAQTLAAQGLVVVNISHRLAPENLYPKALYDVRDAYQWMVENAARFKIRPQHISGMGYSSGGHLVTLTALWAGLKKPGFETVRFHSMVSGGGVYDFMVYDHSPYIKKFTSFYRDENPGLYREASPIDHVTAGVPPFFLFHALNDQTVEHDQALRFAAKLAEKQVAAEVLSIDFWGHQTLFLFSAKALIAAVNFLKTPLTLKSEKGRSEVLKSKD